MTLSRILCGFPRFAAVSRVHLWRGQLMDDFQKGVLTSFSCGFSLCNLTAQAFLKDVKTPFVILISLNHAINSVAKDREARKAA